MLVGPLGQDVLALFVDQHLVDDLADEVVFLVDDVGLVAAVQHPGQVHRVFFGDLLVPLQQLDGVPAQVGQAGVAAAQLGDDLVDLVLDLVRVDHGVFGMVVVLVVGHRLVLVDQQVGAGAVLVVGRCVEQGVQAAALPGRHRDDRDAQHFGQAVQVDLHAPLFHNVHHVQGHDHRLAQLQQLQCQVQPPLQGRGVHHVDDDVHLVAEDELPADRLLHGIRGQAVGAGQVHQVDVQTVVLDRALHLFHRDPRPVGDLEVGAGVGVEQGGLAAVGVADKTNGHVMFLFRHPAAPPLLRCFG